MHFSLYAKDPYYANYQFLISKLEGAGLKHCNDFKVFTECSNDVDDNFENIEEYNPNEECKINRVWCYGYWYA